jgi:hypothetical protein
LRVVGLKIRRISPALGLMPTQTFSCDTALAAIPFNRLAKKEA